MSDKNSQLEKDDRKKRKAEKKESRKLKKAEKKQQRKPHITHWIKGIK